MTRQRRVLEVFIVWVVHAISVTAWTSIPAPQRIVVSPRLTQVVRAHNIVAPEPSFGDAIQEGGELCSALQKGLEPTEQLARLVSTTTGARGFFVNYLTNPDLTMADLGEPPTCVLEAIMSAPADRVAPLMVMNFAMSTASAISHRRAGRMDLAQGSDLTARRAGSLLSSVPMTEAWTNIQAMGMETGDKGSSGHSNTDWGGFFSRQSYDEEQKKAILEGVAGLASPPMLVSLPLNANGVEKDRGGLMSIKFNRPRQLNALNEQCFHDLGWALRKIEKNADIGGALIIAAEGRAFCAGGDIKEAARMLDDGPGRVRLFLHREYEMDLRVHSVAKTKPVVAVANGIVMGGGAGVFMGASHRVVTERTSFAMPEVAIGIVPDAGATYWLAQMPGYVGMYCALTGAGLGPSDLLASGLATHLIDSDRVSALEADLTGCPGDRMGVDGVLGVVSRLPKGLGGEAGGEQVTDMRDSIDRCFSQDSLEGIAGALREERQRSLERAGGGQGPDDGRASWAEASLEGLEKGSPAAQVVAFEVLRLVYNRQQREEEGDHGLLTLLDKALGVELEVNSLLAVMGDFETGVSQTVGAKRLKVEKAQGKSSRGFKTIPVDASKSKVNASIEFGETASRSPWKHGSWAEARADPQVQAILDAANRARPLSAVPWEDGMTEKCQKQEG